MGSHLSIRWRLTLWYITLLAAALLLFGGAFYVGLRHLLHEAFDTTLRTQAAIVQSAITVENQGLIFSPAPLVDLDDDQFIRLMGPQGQVIDTGGRRSEHPVNSAGVARARAGQTDLRWIVSGTDRVRVLSQPVVRNGQVVGVLEVGIESDIEDALGFALQLLAGTVPIILLTAAAGGIWLAGRALAPIDRITRTAAEIEGRDLSRRITHPAVRDEVGRLAETFNAMLDRIEEAFGRQRRFTADAAHELRTPLAMMQSQIELALARPRDPEEDRLVLETLATDVDRLARLSAALLSLARSDAREIQLALELVDLTDLLQLVAEQYAPLAEASGVAIVVDAQPASLTADRDLLLQVMVNLLDNALQHAPERSQVTLGCARSDERAGFWVTDRGAGIPPEHLPHLFERFYRLEPDRDRRRGGIGLGLSICKMIVDAHGGSIAVASAVERGTTVRVMLPLRQAAIGTAPPDRAST